jgi:SNF2 family DNA or RNA helicase
MQVAHLHRMLNPYVLRRLKKDQAVLQIKDKVEKLVSCGLTAVTGVC